MKSLFTLILLVLSISIVSQQSLINKSFSAKVGYVCEETIEPNPCAGQQIYLVLDFKKKEVLVTEKYVTTCGEESITTIGEFKWEINKGNEINILSKPEDIKYSYIKGLSLNLINKELWGKRKEWNNEVTEYHFIKIK